MNEMKTFEFVCPVCGGVTTLELNAEDYELWKGGMPAQHAFPYLSRTTRETMITGFCAECQAKIYGA